MITSVTVRVPAAAVRAALRGVALAVVRRRRRGVRTLAQSGLLPTVLRLSDEDETAINLADPTSVGGDAATGAAA